MLTTSQLQTLKADIVAASDADCQALESAPANGDLAFAVADLYNLPAAIDHWVWRTSVTKTELVNSTSIDATTFNWTGTGFITRSVGERDAWREMFNGTQAVNPSLPQVRQAFADIFSGATAPAPANRTHLVTVSRRKATRVEKLLATGTGSTAVPAAMGSEGPVSYSDILNAMTQP